MAPSMGDRGLIDGLLLLCVQGFVGAGGGGKEVCCEGRGLRMVYGEHQID